MYVCILLSEQSLSSSVSDMDGYVIVRKVLDSVLNIFPLFICWWEIQAYTGCFFLKVADTWYDTPWLIE